MVRATVICGSRDKLARYEELPKTVCKSVYSDVAFLACSGYTLCFNHHEQPPKLFRREVVYTVRRGIKSPRKDFTC